ncbi:hypothetical protein [Nostoc sp.]
MGSQAIALNKKLLLTIIHTSYAYIPFTPSVVLQLHDDLYQ